MFMELPLQITSRDFELPEVYREEIREKAEKLDQYYDRIMRCRVVVETPHRKQHEGKLYNVRIDITVPGGEIVVKREPHEDFPAAIRQAFETASRLLEEHARKQRGDVKRHEETAVARVGKIFHDRGYGFIETPDGREIYFHKNSIVNEKFSKVKIGTEVRFVEEQGVKGPQASTVTVI